MEIKKERIKFGILVMLIFFPLSCIFLLRIPQFIDIGLGLVGIIIVLLVMTGFNTIVFILGYKFEYQKIKSE